MSPSRRSTPCRAFAVALATLAAGCRVVPAKRAEAPAEAAPRPKGPAKNGSAGRFEAELAAKKDDLDALRALRVELWEKGKVDRYPPRAELRRVHQRLAALYAAAGKDLEALRELAIPLPGADHSGPSALMRCERGEEDCETATAKLAAKYSGFCAAPRNCGYLGDEIHEAYDEERRGLRKLVDVEVTGVRKTPGGLVVTTQDSKLTTVRDCLGRFETDKIKEVTTDAIVVERTTWCRKITTSAVKGLKISYVVDPAEDLAVGDSARLLVGRRDQRSKTENGQVRAVEYRGVQVVSVRRGDRWRFANETVSGEDIRPVLTFGL